MSSDSPVQRTPKSTPVVVPKVERKPRRLWPLIVGIALVAGCALVILTAIFLSLLRSTPPIPVTVMVSGAGSQVQTSAHTVGDLLHDLSIAVNDGDGVSPPLDTVLTPNLVVSIERTRTVTLTIDGEMQTLQTLFTNPLDILRSDGITPGEKDRVTVDGTETTFADMLIWPVPATHIAVQHAVTVNIEDDGTHTSIQTARDTVGDALYEAGITLYLADSVTPDLNDPITANMSVSIHRSQPVTVIADGVTLETRTRGNTVADALISANVPLMGLDYAIPDETSALQPGMTIRVIRVTEQVTSQQDAVPFETVYQADPSLELDQRVTLQEGQNGIQQTDTRIRYENGVEVSRQAENTTLAVNPTNRIISYGTNIVLRTVDTPDGPREYWRKLHMYATSYHPSALGGDNITATGKVLTKGIVGVDPKIIPYGTQMYVTVADYGVGDAEDTGGPRRIKLWIDLGYDDSNWVSWSKYVDVYLLTPVPATINYLLPD